MVNAQTDAAPAPRAGRRRLGRALAALFVLLLILSNLAQIVQSRRHVPEAPPGSVRVAVTTPEIEHGGAPTGQTITISALRYAPPTPNPDRAPVILLHGSPGAATNFSDFAPLLAAAGHDVYSVDLPGFGGSDAWIEDFSIDAAAHMLLAAMDGLALPRAHVVGWSQGGGVGIHMASLAPGRVASLTLMGSIGLQETEGSGNYTFEHVKYAVGYGLVVVVPEIIPHFGLLGDRGERHAFIRSFWDTDQRPMRAVMERLSTPTLVLHGRRDVLVPAWGAEVHQQIIPTARLVMLDANHFLPIREPFGQAAETADYVLRFLARHDRPGVPAIVGVTDFAPVKGGGEARIGRFEVRHGEKWWLLALIIILATFITEDGTVIAVGLAIAHNQIDWGVGVLALFVGIALGDGGLWAIGRFFGRRALRWPVIRAWVSEESLERWGRWFDRHTIKAVFMARVVPGTRLPTYIAAGMLSRKTHHFLFWAGVAAFLWTPAILIAVILIGPTVFEAMRSVFAGPVAVILSVVILLLALRTVTQALTWVGRRRLLADLVLPFRVEFWPMWLFYIPLLPYAAYLALRHGPLTFTCLNPGIPHGGGVVGESKTAILSRLSRAAEWIIPTAHIECDRRSPVQRADEVDALLRTDARFGGYPAVLKPDEAQRGHGFKVVRSRDEAIAYFEGMTRSALLQRFHPGPHEVGVLWARTPPPPGASDDAIGMQPGRILSVTRKRFPIIEGDGVSTLERLVWSHPRFRMQGDRFLRRFDAQRDRVLARGERMALAVAGNHCQGTMFLDGDDLVTPALERRIEEIAQSFEHGGFDFGRFDLRYESDEALREGRGFAIIEVNGTMSESTNLYDPGRSVWWTYGVLFRQWRTMYRLGAARRRAGTRPMRPAELLEVIRQHFRGRPGSAIAD